MWLNKQAEQAGIHIQGLLGKCIDPCIVLNELLHDTLHNYVPMAKKKRGKKGESVDVAFATSLKEIEMKITASPLRP